MRRTIVNKLSGKYGSFEGFVCIFTILLISIGSAHADFATGLRSYDNGDYKAAYMEWLPIAEGGDPAAQRNLGHLYRLGRGVTQSFEKAAVWYRKSANQGFPRSQANLANMYLRGQGVPKDAANAAKWFTLAANQNITVAQYNLGLMYENGVGVPTDDVIALGWYYRASKLGHLKAAKRLSKLILSQATPADSISSSSAAISTTRNSSAENKAPAASNLPHATVEKVHSSNQKLGGVGADSQKTQANVIEKKRSLKDPPVRSLPKPNPIIIAEAQISREYGAIQLGIEQQRPVIDRHSHGSEDQQRSFSHLANRPVHSTGIDPALDSTALPLISKSTLNGEKQLASLKDEKFGIQNITQVIKKINMSEKARQMSALRRQARQISQPDIIGIMSPEPKNSRKISVPKHNLPQPKVADHHSSQWGPKQFNVKQRSSEEFFKKDFEVLNYSLGKTALQKKVKTTTGWDSTQTQAVQEQVQLQRKEGLTELLSETSLQSPSWQLAPDYITGSAWTAQISEHISLSSHYNNKETLEQSTLLSGSSHLRGRRTLIQLGKMYYGPDIIVHQSAGATEIKSVSKIPMPSQKKEKEISRKIDITTINTVSSIQPEEIEVMARNSVENLLKRISFMEANGTQSPDFTTSTTGNDNPESVDLKIKTVHKNKLEFADSRDLHGYKNNIPHTSNLEQNYEKEENSKFKVFPKNIKQTTENRQGLREHQARFRILKFLKIQKSWDTPAPEETRSIAPLANKTTSPVPSKNNRSSQKQIKEVLKSSDTLETKTPFLESRKQQAENSFATTNGLQKNARDPIGMPLSAVLDKGMISYQAHDYEKALQLWLPGARAGNPNAQYFVGGLYRDGAGVPVDLVKAHHWWSLAASQNHKQARLLLIELKNEMQAEDIAAVMKLKK